MDEDVVGEVTNDGGRNKEVVPMSLERFWASVERLRQKNVFDEFEGYFGVRNHMGDVKGQVEKRQDGQRDALIKWWRLRWYARYAVLLRDVRALVVVNLLAMQHTKEEGDADLFVVARAGAVWRARLWLVLPLMLFRKRPGEARKHALDVHFLVDEQVGGVEQFAYEIDPYYSVWLHMMMPLFERERGLVARMSGGKIVRTAEWCAWGSGLARWFGGVSIPWAERVVRALQWAWMPQELKESAMLGDGKRVVVSDTVLKLHRTDRRREIVEYVEQRMSLCEQIL